MILLSIASTLPLSFLVLDTVTVNCREKPLWYTIYNPTPYHSERKPNTVGMCDATQSAHSGLFASAPSEYVRFTCGDSDYFWDSRIQR